MQQVDWQPALWDKILFVLLHYVPCYVLPTLLAGFVMWWVWSAWKDHPSG
jgi:hypothetical protein